VQASEKTAALLENLLVFYDRLAEQAGNDRRVILESAIASRRVGDIRQRLGQIDHAEEEYRRALEKLRAWDVSSPADVEVCVERARCYNEIGSVRSARFEPEPAYQAHEEAFAALKSLGRASDELTGRLSEEYRYELARTYYLLGSKCSTAFGGRGGDGDDRGPQLPSVPPYQGREHRKSAIRILEELAEEYPDAPDYRFLLALCHRPPGVVPEPARGSAGSQGRQRALRLLEELKREYPQVADYRYELAATYAWVHVGLFPWQGRSTSTAKAEQGLRKALDELAWLVAHNPTIPHYARSKALILAKLGAVCWETGRVAGAAPLFEQAVETQSALVDGLADLPSHDRVLLEFFRLRLAAVYGRQGTGSEAPDAPRRSRELLEICVRNLAELASRPKLADDRLTSSALRIAREALMKSEGTTARGP
jgi:tetratricopeptide (TPR) repeat protein